VKYFEQFTDYDEFIHRWGGIHDAPTDEQILFAYYSYEDYSGYALAIFQRDGKLFEVSDSHCSCNGLENWEPEETTWASLAMRDPRFTGDAKAAFDSLVQTGMAL